jgi:hypothetical protein
MPAPILQTHENKNNNPFPGDWGESIRVQIFVKER